jgi:hypothetical protein
MERLSIIMERLSRNVEININDLERSKTFGLETYTLNINWTGIRILFLDLI